MSTTKRYMTRVLGILSILAMSLVGIVIPAAQPASAASYPDHIVNGDFNYPVIPSNWWDLYGDKRFLTINPDRGVAGAGCSNENQYTISGFSAATFGWSSTQTQIGSCSPHNVEINYSPDDKNVYAELVADQSGTSIYQDVATTPGAVYNWSLRHTSASSKFTDSMQVMLGAPGKETAQNAVRTTTNGLGDKTGSVGTTIRTPSGSSSFAVKAWESYKGTYLVPAGQTVTRFKFNSLASIDATSGNDIDDVKFSVSYPLTYDANGGTGTIPHTGYNSSTGIYDNYYTPSTSVTLSGNKMTRSGMTFLGWSTKKLNPLATANDVAGAGVITKLSMPSQPTTVYAVYALNKTLHYNVNAPSGTTAPAKPADETVDYNTPASDNTGWSGKKDSLINGYSFDGWYTDTKGITAYDFSTKLTSDVNVYAKWTAKPASLVYYMNDGSSNSKAVSGVTAQSISIISNPFNRAGFKFLRWNTKADGSGTTYTPAQLYSLPAGSSAVYAIWEPVATVMPHTGSMGGMIMGGVFVIALLAAMVALYKLHKYKDSI